LKGGGVRRALGDLFRIFQKGGFSGSGSSEGNLNGGASKGVGVLRNKRISQHRAAVPCASQTKRAGRKAGGEGLCGG